MVSANLYKKGKHMVMKFAVVKEQSSRPSKSSGIIGLNKKRFDTHAEATAWIKNVLLRRSYDATSDNYWIVEIKQVIAIGLPVIQDIPLTIAFDDDAPKPKSSSVNEYGEEPEEEEES